jgi:hypothetical protein
LENGTLLQEVCCYLRGAEQLEKNNVKYYKALTQEMHEERFIYHFHVALRPRDSNSLLATMFYFNKAKIVISRFSGKHGKLIV